LLLYDGTDWNLLSFSQISISIPSTRNTIYDVFVYDNSGTLALELLMESVIEARRLAASAMPAPSSRQPANTFADDELVTINGNTDADNNATWRINQLTTTTFELKNLDGTNPAAPGSVGTGGTAQRADQNTGRTTLVLRVNGVLVKDGATTRRYVGTIRTSQDQTAGRVDDSEASRFVWNYYNRVPRKLKVIDTTNSWTYASAAWRAARNTLANRVELVIGLSEMLLQALVTTRSALDATEACAVGLGINALTTNSADLYHDMQASATNTDFPPGSAWYSGYPTEGYNFLQWLEYARSGTVDFLGDGGFVTHQGGLKAEVWG
jgi:hypothetical protein